MQESSSRSVGSMGGMCSLCTPSMWDARGALAMDTALVAPGDTRAAPGLASTGCLPLSLTEVAAELFSCRIR